MIFPEFMEDFLSIVMNTLNDYWFYFTDLYMRFVSVINHFDN